MIENKKCELCGKEAHHIHHKDKNNKNNKPSNLQNLCTLCHAKIHGTEPRKSEIGVLVSCFNKTQKLRVITQLSIKSFERVENANTQIPAPHTENDWEEEFKNTKFGKGGGLAFECSDFEGMYVELKDFIRQQRLKAQEELKNRINNIIGEFGDTPLECLQIIDDALNGKKDVEF